MNHPNTAISDDRRGRLGVRLTRLAPGEKPEGPSPLKIPPRISFVLCVFVVAIFAGAPPKPAQALEQKIYGNVFVDSGTTAEEASTALGNVTVHGIVDNSVSSVYGNIRVNGPVGGGVRTGFGDVKIREPVKGGVVVSFGDVYVDSRVGGDVDVGQGELRLGPDAVVNGHVSVANGTIHATRGAVLRNRFVGGLPSITHDSNGASPIGFIWWLSAAVVLVVCCVLATVIVPRPVHAATLRAEQHPGRALLFGATSVTAAVMLAVVLSISVVGIPVLLLLAPAYLALLFLGTVVATFSVGRKVLALSGHHHTNDTLAAAVGALIVATAYPIPLIGHLIFYALTLFGAGAIILVLLGPPITLPIRRRSAR